MAEIIDKMNNYVIVSTNVQLLKQLGDYNTKQLDLEWSNKEHYDHAVYIGSSKDDKIVAWCMQPDQLIAIHPVTGQVSYKR